MSPDDKTVQLLQQLVEHASKTNEQLADLRRGIDETNTRIDETNQRVGQTNERLDSLGGQVGRTNERLDSLTGQVIELRTETHEMRTEMRDGFAAVNTRLDGVIRIAGEASARLDARVTRIEQHLGL